MSSRIFGTGLRALRCTLTADRRIRGAAGCHCAEIIAAEMALFGVIHLPRWPGGLKGK
ncbi:MAG TPA: hypothetical protein VE133_18885 [Candidatus Sulfotelmatobacter sp.]|nr:hypothetical protein [Candidatus Sulfotelmatobacter sp.]